MIRFLGPKFYYVTTLLSGMESSFGITEWVKQNPSGEIVINYNLPVLFNDIDDLVVHLKELLMNDCAYELVRVKNTLDRLNKGEATVTEAINIINSFRRRVHDALKVPVMLMIRDVYMFDPKNHLFGEAVDCAFPSSSLEVADAGKCLAVGQPTAAVFHLMRALEPALVALGKKFNVDVTNNWNKALNDIEKEFRKRDNKPEYWNSDDEQFYASAISQFFNIKNAWRNHTMHLRLRFSDSQANGIFSSTKAFMQQLSIRISE